MIEGMKKINLLSRFGLAFIFLYHGFFPKIFSLSSIEVELSELHGMGEYAEVVSQFAGVAEIVLGILIIFLRKTLTPVFTAGGMLLLLLVDVAYVKPSLLIEAFNPVSINISGIILCCIVYLSHVEITHNKSN